MANSEYLEMIELPVSTCEMVTPQKKKKFFKGRLIRSVNKKVEEDNKAQEPQIEAAEMTQVPETVTEPIKIETVKEVKSKERKERPKFKLDLIGAEVIAIFVLVVTILLTNIFWEDSGINTMIRSVFGSEAQAQVDDRLNTAFSCVAPSKTGEIEVIDGVMNIAEKSVIYPPYQGTVTKAVEANGLYTITVAHSDVFYSVISGVEFVYCQVGDKVYDNLPIAYSGDGGTQVAMYNNGEIVKNFIIDNGNIVWQS